MSFENNSNINSLCTYALAVLSTSDAHEKAYKTREYASFWRNSKGQQVGKTDKMPSRPARPAKPELLYPRDMPKRKKGNNDVNKAILLHALSHIELNAIDLAWDIIARFSHFYEGIEFSLPLQFYIDWLKVADDEAKHFLMLSDRLEKLNCRYGDYPAHDGLWESAAKTAENFPARLAIVPMVLEARGLDVTPNMITLMESQGDQETADMLKIILEDEITHVRAGSDWFKHWCDFYKKDEEEYFQELVNEYFHGSLRAPFNHEDREEAGMIRDWYEPLAG